MEKIITIDGEKYRLVPVEAQFEESKKEPKDKYDNLKKLIGRNCGDLCILGEKMLKSIVFSFGRIIIQYDDINREDFDDELNFEETTLGKLEYGDMFVLEEYSDTKKHSDVNVFLSKDDDGDFVCQYTYKDCGVERQGYAVYILRDTKVIKALRN